MNILPESTRSGRVHIPLHYAEELSHAASSFGAATRREARKYPGGFERPVVGFNPGYFMTAARKVVREAVATDPELGRLYNQAASLSSRLNAETTPPYSITGPQPQHAEALVGVTSSLQQLLEAKNLRLPLAGKSLERARDISAFAIRVIEGQGVGALLADDRGGLYPGLPADTPTNTVEYWAALQEELNVPAEV